MLRTKVTRRGDRETSQTRDADVINEDDDHRADSTQIKAISVPKHLTCSLTLELMVDPVFAEDGNLYEREILKWIATNKIVLLTQAAPWMLPVSSRATQ